jgi:hypothetical protein
VPNEVWTTGWRAALAVAQLNQWLIT